MLKKIYKKIGHRALNLTVLWKVNYYVWFASIAYMSQIDMLFVQYMYQVRKQSKKHRGHPSNWLQEVSV